MGRLLPCLVYFFPLQKFCGSSFIFMSPCIYNHFFQFISRNSAEFIDVVWGHWHVYDVTDFLSESQVSLFPCVRVHGQRFYSPSRVDLHISPLAHIMIPLSSWTGPCFLCLSHLAFKNSHFAEILSLLKKFFG